MSDMMKIYGYSSDEFDFDPSIFKSKKRNAISNRNPAGAKPMTKREKILQRDGFACLRCGARQNLTLDHIIPKSRGGTNCQRNLQTLCGGCNKAKGNKNCKDYRKNKK